ncbi:MAG: hypothetical protein ACREI8_11715 [Myxococcota bacterium]
MVVDTGADACYFDHQLAYEIGVNPVHGGKISKVEAMSSSHPTARFPVTISLPQLGVDFPVDAEFAQLQKGWNGMLGHQGFLERFERVTFVPGQYFELVLP